MRIAIVNDMRTAVEALRRVVLNLPGVQLAWVAGDGKEAVKICIEDPPDLILMDLYMPVMDGVEATRLIMAQKPCPILIVTASVEGHASKVFNALGVGALDAVKTPILGTGGQTEGGAELRFKIETIGRMLSHKPGPDSAASAGIGPRPRPTAADKLVVIGASAGGPTALATVLERLPRDLAAAVVIVQHIDFQFVASMVDWLGKLSALPVRVIKEGDELREGIALVAATNDHLVLRKSGRLGYTPEPRDGYYKPSVDVFFESVGLHWNGVVAAVLLTGMGRDGAKGLKSLRTAGAHTIAQDRASCVVYGMPKAAAEINAALEILSLEKIAPRLMAILTNKH